MTAANPEPYDERVRLAEIIADARALIAHHPAAGADRMEWVHRTGALEAMLKILADSAAESSSTKQRSSPTPARDRRSPDEHRD